MTGPDQHERLAEVGAALASVRERIAVAARRAGRAPDDVTLVAVTKTFPASDIAALAELGVADVGESRDQEARSKRDDLADPGDVTTARLRWHFVGRLQRNKAASVARWADVVHSVDRASLLTGLARGASESGRRLDVFIQVSLDDDASRGGAPVSELAAIADAVAAAPDLRLLGVMTVPPQDADPDRAFARLGAIAVELQRSHPGAVAISAGMSADFESAIAQGATHVRVGSALLGSRPPLLS